MENGPSRAANDGAREINSINLREALRQIECATALISTLIRNELQRPGGRGNLDRLYAAKGGLTCAIEETRLLLAKEVR